MDLVLETSMQKIFGNTNHKRHLSPWFGLHAKILSPEGLELLHTSNNERLPEGARYLGERCPQDINITHRERATLPLSV